MTAPAPQPNVTQAVPFFRVTSMEASLRFYLDGLGFTMKNKWTPDGHIRWCWLELGDAAIMLQEFHERHKPAPGERVGLGVSIAFQCRDAIAIYHEAVARGIEAGRPFVGNGLWVTVMTDPDGYRLEFASPTDAPEESVYSDPAA